MCARMSRKHMLVCNMHCISTIHRRGYVAKKKSTLILLMLVHGCECKYKFREKAKAVGFDITLIFPDNYSMHMHKG